METDATAPQRPGAADDTGLPVCCGTDLSGTACDAAATGYGDARPGRVHATLVAPRATTRF